MSRLDVQTTKSEYKDLPCTFPGCENQVRVNKFYTPAKARCNDHQTSVGGVSTPSVLAQTMARVTQEPPSGALTNLACPAHPETKMRILATASRFSGGVMLEMQCPTCFIVVKIDTSLNRQIPAKSYLNEPYWPDWAAYLKSRDCKCGNRIAAFRAEGPSYGDLKPDGTRKLIADVATKE